MRRSIIRVFMFLSVMALPCVVHAVGLGNLTLNSYLGQPFKAEIDLVAVKKEEIPSLVASLASRDTFKQANVDYVPFLFTFEISIENRANGQPYIKITSPQRVVEPFLSMLIELNWSSGRLIREYTVLLDPPEDALQPTAPAMQVEPVVPSSIKPEPAPAEEPDSIIEDFVSDKAPVIKEVAPVQKEAAPVQKEVAPVKEAAPVEKPSITTYGPVKKGDTLAKIALEVAPPHVQLNQMLIAMHRANREAFSDNNINRLKTGPILRVPDASEIATISPDAADKEVKVQTANWEAYRQKLAADVASTAPTSEESTQTATGRITATIESDAAETKELAKKESLKISKGKGLEESGSDKAIGDQDRIHSLEENAIAREKALIEANERVALLEKNVKELQQLLELKNVAIAKAQQQAENIALDADTKPLPPAVVEKTAPPVEVPSLEGEEASSPATKEAPSVEAEPSEPVVSSPPPPPVAKPPVKQVPTPIVVEDPPLIESIMDSVGPIIDGLMENIEYVGAAILLLLTGIFGAAAIRRKKETSIDNDNSSDVDTTSSTKEDSSSQDKSKSAADKTKQTDDYDPVVEAGQYLDHGRDAQAEKILKDALAKDQNNPEMLAKLLEVHTLRKDKPAFEATARALWAVSPTGPLWERAARLGLSIDPENPFYGGSVASTGSDQIEDTESVSSDSSFSHKVTTSEPESSIGVSEEGPEQKPEVQEQLDEPSFGIEFSSSQEAETSSETPVTESPPTSSDDMSIDFPSSDSENEPAPTVTPSSPGLPESDLAGINLNIDDSVSTASSDTQSVEKSAKWHDLATKIDLARAYQEMGDNDGAKEILQEVIKEGDSEQQESAKVILESLKG